MIHVIIERDVLADAIAYARVLYTTVVSTGRHTILDTPQDFKTNLPERRLSSAEVLIQVPRPHQPTAIAA